MSSPAAQVSSLDHSTQSSLPDVVHFEEGKETGKSTVSERRFRQEHRESLGKDRNKERGPETEPWRKREAKTKTRKREKANEAEDRERMDRETPKRGTFPALPRAWAEGRSRPPLPT